MSSLKIYNKHPPSITLQYATQEENDPEVLCILTLYRVTVPAEGNREPQLLLAESKLSLNLPVGRTHWNPSLYVQEILCLPPFFSLTEEEKRQINQVISQADFFVYIIKV